MGQSRPLFVYFLSFLVTISIQIEKSIDGVLGIRIQGHRMVGGDETTELWRPPHCGKLLLAIFQLVRHYLVIYDHRAFKQLATVRRLVLNKLTNRFD